MLFAPKLPEEFLRGWMSIIMVYFNVMMQQKMIMVQRGEDA
jgi:hypothetical protein